MSVAVHQEMMSIKREIDIMIPTHGKMEHTIRCIKSIYKNTRLPFHLIVVDDSTPDMDEDTDMTPQWMERWQAKHKNVTFIHSDKQFKCGNEFFNIGLRNCKTDLMATVMNSMTVEPEWEIVGTKLFENDPKVGVVGFKCLFPWNTIESAGIVMRGFTPQDIGAHMPSHYLATVIELPAVQWAFAMVRKKAAEGNLDETIFHGFKGWDDIDNCFVLRKKGWKVMYCGLGVGYHTPRATRGDDSEQAAIDNHENAQCFYKRWGYWDEYLRANGGNVNIPKEEFLCLSR